MSRSNWLKWRFVVLLITMSLLMGPSTHLAFAQQLPQPPTPTKYAFPNLDSLLVGLHEKHLVSKEVALKFAEEKHIPVEDDLVTVIIEPVDSNPANIDQRALEALGVVVVGVSMSLMEARIPASQLKTAASTVAGVDYIRLPYIPVSDLETSEGVDLTGATSYHGLEIQGKGIRIAIIDLGFEGLATAKASGELPPDRIAEERDYTDTGLETDGVHGTAVAEIVHDMAPRAMLYLKKVGNSSHLENAVNDAIAQGIDIISHSVGWYNTNFGDGTGTVANAANNARANGILFVKSAGNCARKHWEGAFVDGNGNDWHEFGPGDETINIDIPAGSTLKIYTTWNDWTPGDDDFSDSDQDYDLYLYDSTLTTVVASSTWTQNGTQSPIERIEYTAPTTGTYRIAVSRYNAPERPNIEIFTDRNLGEHRVPSSSITAPGNATGAFTVAAINQENWTTGPQRPFSSQGPTSDGRTKPDITGPDGVTTSTYGAINFPGTSASTPHVAGAAALVLERNPGLTTDELQQKLEEWAVDMGVTGKDNIYGSGRLDLAVNQLPSAPSLTEYPKFSLSQNYPNPCNPETTIEYSLADSCHVTLKIYNLSGQLIKTLINEYQQVGSHKITWYGDNDAGQEVASGVYFYRIKAGDFGSTKKMIVLK